LSDADDSGGVIAFEYGAVLGESELARGVLSPVARNRSSCAWKRIAGRDLISSGDSLADQQERQVFLDKYQQMHRLVQEPDGNTELYIGAENWPFLVPLVAKNGEWFFDSDSGVKTMLLCVTGAGSSRRARTTKRFGAVPIK
jgi:hypothetical protein